MTSTKIIAEDRRATWFDINNRDSVKLFLVKRVLFRLSSRVDNSRRRSIAGGRRKRMKDKEDEEEQEEREERDDDRRKG